jgi:hypothetical protein
MNEGLWSWQDDDARRLRREGKEALAGRWDTFGLDAAALKESAELAREMHEPVWELFYLHWHVQQGLFRESRNLQQLQPAVERLTQLAGMPSCQACPQRFCARESVANFQLCADPPGFASAVLKMSRAMAEQVPDGLECGRCFDLLEVSALMEMKRLDEAIRVLDRIEVDLDDDNLTLLNELYRAAVAHERGQLDVMDEHLRTARARLADGAVPNPDNLWYLLELEIQRSITLGDLQVADALLETSRPTPPPSSSEGIRIHLVLAGAHAGEGQWEASRTYAECALAAARDRGMVRYAAEAGIRAAEACRELHEVGSLERLIGELELLLPQLRSRDLDERARALGIS